MYFWRIAHLCLQLRSSTASWCRASFVSQRSLCGNAFDLSISLSLSLFISPPSFSLWFHNTCHLMLFTQYSLLDQFYFCTSCLSIVHFKFTNKIHQLFTDYLLRLPYSELLETHLFRSRANRRLLFYPPLMYLYRMSLWSFMECSFGYHSIHPHFGGIDRTGWNKQVHEPSLLIP